MPRRRLSERAALGAVLLLTAAGCDDAPEAVAPPDDYRLLEHQVAAVGVPDDWDDGDDETLLEADPDAVVAEHPDAEELHVGASLWRYSEPVSTAEEAVSVMAGQLSVAPGHEQHERRSLEVAGSDDAFLIQLSIEAPALDGQTVFFTYAGAMYDNEHAVLMRLVGPEDLITEQMVEVALETLRVDGG